jgi:hypothetical protein
MWHNKAFSSAGPGDRPRSSFSCNNNALSCRNRYGNSRHERSRPFSRKTGSDRMEHVKTISELLSGAETLGEAVMVLASEYPDLTLCSLLAVETAEVVELGWGPTAAHRDCSYLTTLAAILQPVGREHGDIPVIEACRLLMENGHDGADEIASALEALSGAARDGT